MKLKIPPAIVACIFGGVMWLIDLYLNIDWLNFKLTVWISIVFAGMGGLFGFIGLIQFCRHSTSIDPHKPDKARSLVTNGIYRISRNPMYAGLLLILTGYGFYLGNMLTFAMPLLFVEYMNRYQIMPEEEVLADKFGDKYLRYKNEVPRWL